MTYAIHFFGAFGLVMLSTVTAVKLANSVWFNNLYKIAAKWMIGKANIPPSDFDSSSKPPHQ